MLRGSVIAFVAGWFLWLWIDKNPMALGPPPHGGGGDMLQNFQIAVDLLQQGRVRAAYVFIWQAHYLVLSLAFGLLAAILAGSVSSALSRRRLRKLYIPDRNKARSDAEQPKGNDSDS